MENDRVRRRCDDAHGDQWPLAAADVRKHESAVGALPVQSIKLLVAQPSDRLNAVDDGVTVDVVPLALADLGGVECVIKIIQRECSWILSQVVDDVALEAGRQHTAVLSDVTAATGLIDIEQGGDQPVDDADAGALPATALVIRDHRRGDIDLGGQLGLGDVEIGAPLLQRRAGVVAQRDLAGDPVGEILTDGRCHRIRTCWFIRAVSPIRKKACRTIA